jgi:hypothetical protein
VNRARQFVRCCPASLPPCSPLAASSSRYVPVSLLSATRRSHPQLLENTAILSPATAALAPRIDAKLTRVNHNPFICHSYEKHPGWGMPLQSSRLLFPRTPSGPAQRRPQPKSFHAFTSRFSGYPGGRASRFSAFSVSFVLKDTLHLANPSAHWQKPSHVTSSLSLFTTHYPRLTRSTVRFTRSIPGATHV